MSADQDQYSNLCLPDCHASVLVERRRLIYEIYEFSTMSVVLGRKFATPLQSSKYVGSFRQLSADNHEKYHWRFGASTVYIYLVVILKPIRIWLLLV